jgi:hypothetical protein
MGLRVTTLISGSRPQTQMGLSGGHTQGFATTGSVLTTRSSSEWK